jgi:hypothetical protein
MPDDIFLGGVPPTPDPFPSFWLGQPGPGGMVLVESRLPAAVAESMLAMVKSLPRTYSFEICDRDESAALVEGSVPMSVALDLLKMLPAADPAPPAKRKRKYPSDGLSPAAFARLTAWKRRNVMRSTKAPTKPAA